jgi:hypothetical protein
MALNLADSRPNAHSERMLDYLESRLRELRPVVTTRAAE